MDQFHKTSCLYQDIEDLKNNVKEISSYRRAHMGQVSFFHDYCNSSLGPHSQICCDKEAEPRIVALPVGLLEHKRTDWMVEHEVVVKGNLHYGR